MEGAVNTVIQTMQLGIPVARMEVIDETQLAFVNRYSKTSYPEAPTLFFEFHGTSQARGGRPGAAVEEIAQEHGALGFQWASTPEDRARLWQARHDAYYATVASRPGAGAMTTDVCVPISQLAPCILETQADAARLGDRRPARRPRRRRQLPPDPDARSGRRRRRCGGCRRSASGWSSGR